MYSGNDGNLANLAFFNSNLRNQFYLPNASTVAAEDFDWYISPMSKLNYENEFDRLASDDLVELASLSHLAQNAKISDTDWITICNLVDIRGDGTFSRDQYVYLQHILQTRRRLNKLPLSLPLNVKEKLLQTASKDHGSSFVRPRQMSSASSPEKALLERQINDLQSQVDEIDKKIDQAKLEAKNAQQNEAHKSTCDSLNQQITALENELQNATRELEKQEKANEETESEIELKKEYKFLLEKALNETLDLSDDKSSALFFELQKANGRSETKSASVDTIFSLGNSLQVDLDKKLKKLIRVNEETRVDLAKIRLE